MKQLLYIFNSRKTIIKRIISVLIVIILTSQMLLSAGVLLNDKKRDKSLALMGKDVDIFLLGNSHMRWTIFPMELWNNKGYTSYMLAKDGYMIPQSYWSFKNALKVATPKLVIIDIYRISRMEKYDTFANCMAEVNSFPLSVEKAMAAYDLTDEFFGEKGFLSCFFGYSTFHSRWNEINKDDFDMDYSFANMANTRFYLSQYPQKSLYRSDNIAEFKTEGMLYLEKIIKLAKSEGIEVLLINVPQVEREEAVPYYNYANELARKYDISYLDLNNMENLVDFSTDLGDFHEAETVEKAIEEGEYIEGDVIENVSHLNIAGAMKVTNYLGEYLDENYNLSDHRSEKEYDYWNSEYKKWIDRRCELLNENQGVFTNYLNLLYPNYYDVRMVIYNEEVLRQERIPEVFLNLGIDTNEIQKFPCCILLNKDKECVILNDVDKQEIESNTNLGLIWVKMGENGMCLYVNEEKVMDIDDNNKNTGCSIATYRSDTGELVNRPSFGWDAQNYQPVYKIAKEE